MGDGWGAAFFPCFLPLLRLTSANSHKPSPPPLFFFSTSFYPPRLGRSALGRIVESVSYSLTSSYLERRLSALKVIRCLVTVLVGSFVRETEAIIHRLGANVGMSAGAVEAGGGSGTDPALDGRRRGSSHGSGAVPLAERHLAAEVPLLTARVCLCVCG